jgi:peptide chain release factor 1
LTTLSAPRNSLAKCARLKDLTAVGQKYLKTLSDLAENRALLASEPQDSELAQMAHEEVVRLEAEEQALARDVEAGILPPDPADSRNTILELRAGAGGQESALFAADLFRWHPLRGSSRVEIRKP